MGFQPMARPLKMVVPMNSVRFTTAGIFSDGFLRVLGVAPVPHGLEAHATFTIGQSLKPFPVLRTVRHRRPIYGQRDPVVPMHLRMA